MSLTPAERAKRYRDRKRGLLPAYKPATRAERITMTAETETDFVAAAPEIVARCIQLAKDGHPDMIKLAMSRILPPLKIEHRVKLDGLPPLTSVETCSAAVSLIVQAAADGRLSLDDAERLSSLIERVQTSLIATATEQRVAALEANGITLDLEANIVEGLEGCDDRAA